MWLDLYAGTGAVGIEALSRGARQVYFVESAKKHARLLRENLQSLGIDAGFEVQEREVVKALSLLESTGVVCDFCFLDPPYRMRGTYEQTLGHLAQSRLLQPSTIVIAEHEKKFDLDERFGALRPLSPTRPGRCLAQLLQVGIRCWPVCTTPRRSPMPKAGYT